MAGETGPEASSQTSEVASQVASERIAEMMRLAREAAQNARGKASDDERKPVRSPEPIATQLAPMQKTVTSQTSSPVHPSNWFVEQRSSAPKRVANESRSPAPLPSFEPIAKAPAEIQKTVARESTSAVQSPAPLVERARPRVITVYRASDYMPVLDLETGALQSAARVPVPPLGHRLASWWIAIGSTLRGPWRDAVWDFYERMTDLSWWWRAVIKPVLKLLARFIPGREPEPSRVSKAIREGFRFLHEPPPQWQPKKPQDPRRPAGRT